MQATDVATNQTLETVLQVLSWLVIIFGSLWFVTGILGYLHRRAYNLTNAESGGSKPITPDFLKVDKKKRQAAIDRGEAYDEILDRRAAPSNVEKMGYWSRAGAMVSATMTLIAAVVGTMARVDSLQAGVENMSSWDSFTALVAKYPAGATVAVLVIGANIIVFVKATKKTPAKA